MATKELSVSKLSSLDDESFRANHLHFKIKGNEINEVIVNVIRRIILEEIPCVSFQKEGIEITSNTSIYNNDYMRNRIENFPLIGIKTKLDLNEYEKLRKYTRGLSTSDEFLEDENVELDNDSYENLLSINCDIKNSNDSILNVTSEDVSFYKGDEKINSIYKSPILIIKLKPGENFKFSAKASKGIALNNAGFSCVNICCYEMINKNEYNFKFEPKGQQKSSEILENAFKIIKYRLELIKSKIMESAISTNNNGSISFENEDHTFGNLITRGLQEHNNIEFAGYKLENLLIKNIIIEYVTNGGKNIKDIFIDVLKKYIAIFENLNKLCSKF
jgi:DNA-directed RNA polymerase subunit L